MPSSNRGNRAGSVEDRTALFSEIVDKIMHRDAFVPVKLERLGVDVREAMLRFRDEMINADTDEKLFYTLLKINNARKDPHVPVHLVPGGLRPEGVKASCESRRVDHLDIRQAPIHFAVDYGNPNEYSLFVADYGDRVEQSAGECMPEIGDELVAVNDQSFADYLVCIEPYNRYATFEGFWWRMATKVAQDTLEYPPHFRGDGVSFTLRGHPRGEYTITLPYLDPDSITWQGVWKEHGAFRYPGFELLLQTSSYHFYRHKDRRIVLLDWNKFDENLMENMDELMEFSSEHDLLDCAVIFDATRAGGGSLGAYVIQRLSPKPFKTTFGNLRITDMVEPFAKMMQERRARGEHIAATVDGGDWLVDWLQTDVQRAIREGKNYSNNVPFKSSHLPKNSDGVLQPAELHFTGPMICLFSPHGGSHLDQFAAMVYDNQLGYSIGMPTAGYSNTWEAEETLYFPTSGQPVVRFMYSMGHTVRPNGELLEGNPAPVHEYIALTRNNYHEYHEMLLTRALELL